MPDEAVETQTPAAEPTADAGAAPEVSASEGAPDRSQHVDMNDAMRQIAFGPSQPASKPAAASASPETDHGPDEASAPDDDGASKPSDQPESGISRRSAPAEIERLRQENARLQQALDEANPPPPDATEEARKRHIEDEKRYRSLIRLPDDHPTLAEGDNWSWLQEEKRKRELFPDLAERHETILADDRRALEEEYALKGRTFLGNLRQQVASSLEMPGITDDERQTLTTTTNWLDHVLIHRAAAERVAEERNAEEIARLRKDNERLRKENLSRARVPVDGGRPTNGPIGRDMNEVMRQIAGIS